MNKIFLTVDTECHDIKKENQYIWGRKNGKENGIRHILELGKKYQIPINFFVDFPEEKRYGKDFIKRIIAIIKEYGQPIFLHLHPNFITNDEKKTFLWQYSYEEQEKILKEGITIYEDLMGKRPTVFRAGRYGVNKDTYDLLDKILPGIVDCSYTGGYGKMCHVEQVLVHTVNHYSKYKSVQIMPNCRFIALDLFGKRKFVGVDASEMSLIEFREFLKEAGNRDFVLTMHSWNFIDRYFWSDTHVGRHKTNERLFKGMVDAARKNGYEFVSIEKYNFDREGSKEDISYNASGTLWKKGRSLFLNFWRFQQMAKISSKFLYIYGVFYLILAIFLAVVLAIEI